MTRLYRLAVLAAIGTYALVVLGGVARLAGSGTGCGDDWPLCRGKPYPPLESTAIVEYLHRVVAVSLGGVALAVALGTVLVAGVRPRTKIAAWVTVALVDLQATVGAVAVRRELPSEVASVHLGAVMLFLAGTILTLYYVARDRGAPGWIVRAGFGATGGQPPGAAGRDRTFLRVAQVGALATLLLILTGGATATSGASLSCDAWPWCLDTRFVPDRASDETWINLSHRALAVAGAAVLAGVAYAARRRRAAPEAQRLALAACGVFAVEVLIGAAYVWSGGEAWISATHLAAAALIWGLMLGVAIVAGRAWDGTDAPVAVTGGASRAPERRHWSPRAALAPASAIRSSLTRVSANGTEPAVRPAGYRLEATGGAVALAPSFGPTPFVLIQPDLRRAREVVAGYVTLTKPGILTLLLLTTLAAMLVAAEGFPAFGLVLATLVGGTLAAGGANALNCYLDRDIDALMPRTRRRGTASGRIAPRAALTFGVALTALAIVELGVLVNLPAALLALAGNLFYVFVYTKWLKRSTPQNIVIGGAAGAVPPLVGWAAVTGDLAWAPWLMFATIFTWTPPHFWALALLKQGEYGRAAVPMLPVVAGEVATRRQILLYTVALVPVTLALCLTGLSWIYLVAALVLNGVFLALAWRLWRTPSKRLARQTFFWSLWYLAFLFAAMVADRLILA